MNPDHARLCSSAEWAKHIADVVLPEALHDLRLGDDVLEIGPGYGASTAELLRSAASLTAIEVDEELAAELASTFPEVTVARGSGDDLPFGADRFSAVVCFTMLHHVPSATAQDGLFTEARRVLRPGGLFAGSDSIASGDLADFHHDDTYVPVDPEVLPHRLTMAGFTRVEVNIGASGERFTFIARA